MVYTCRSCGNHERFIEEYVSFLETPIHQVVRVGKSGAAIPEGDDPHVSLPDLVRCALCGGDDVSIYASLLSAA